MASPAAIPATRPKNGLLDAYVTAAAVNAPASIIPSSAILITPERSENIPPNAASTRGVANLTVDQMSDTVNISLIASYFRALKQSEHLTCFAEECFSRYK